MQVKSGLLATAVVTGLVLSACSGGGSATSANPGSGADSSASQGGGAPQSAGSCSDTDELIKEDLTLTGEVTDHITFDCNEKIGDTDNCKFRNPGFGAVLEKVRVGGRDADFSINIITATGAGSYAMPTGSTTQYFIFLNIDDGPKWAAQKSVVNTVVINADLRSGTIDAELAPNGNGATGNLHVKGTWRCLP